MGEYIHNYQDQLDHLLTLDGDKLLDIIEKYGGSVIVNENQIINQRTSEVDEKCLTQLEGGDYQAVIVDDTYFIREPKVTQFVMNQYEKGSSVVVMSIEGIYNLSVLNRKFNVDWNVCAYTSRDIKLTERGKDIIGDAFPRKNHYIKANFVVGEGPLFTEHQHPEDYEDEEDFPNGPPPPEPGSPFATVMRGSRSVSYFGFVNPLDVSYGAILLKLCYAGESLTSRNSTTNSGAVLPVLPVTFVQQIAQVCGYTEVYHNEMSRMISFKKGSTRINVYYTTGTVGTCLNHPKHGKTQLFRRNVSVSTLRAIFENPRTHTGTGYYKRKHITQKWKLEGNNSVFLNDSARRWQYVGDTTGLIPSVEEMQTVIEIVTEWEALYWEDGDPPDLQHTNFYCGSRGGLLRMMYKVAQETCGDFQCWSHNSGKLFAGNSMPYNHKCDNLKSFMQYHRSDVDKIKRKFESLSRDVRIELMQWYMGREACGMHLVDMEGELIVTKWSLLVSAAHVDYGKIMYPKSAGLCPCCGIVSSEGDTW